MTENKTELNQIEIPKVNVESLLADNRSVQAREALKEAAEAKRRGERTLVRVCSDARVSPTFMLGRRDLISFSSIAGSGDIPRHALRHSGVKRVLTGTHFNCGGQNAVANGLEGVTEEHTRRYLERKVLTGEQYLQSYESAQLLAAETEQPTLAVIIDHETGRILPIAYWTDKGRTSKTAIPQAYLRSDRFDHEKLYQNGSTPTLRLEELPKELAELIVDNDRVVKQLGPDFTESQRVQDPHTVVISTVALPSALRYPNIFGKPNTVFSIGAEYQKDQTGVVGFNDKQLKDVIGHAWYPIASQAGGHGFSSLSTYLIEAPQMAMAKQLAQKLLEQEWFAKWSGQVLVAEVKSGVTENIEKLPR